MYCWLCLSFLKVLLLGADPEMQRRVKPWLAEFQRAGPVNRAAMTFVPLTVDLCQVCDSPNEEEGWWRSC